MIRSAPEKDEILTALNHETVPSCCGCWHVIYDADGLTVVCNECGEKHDIVRLLTLAKASF